MVLVRRATAGLLRLGSDGRGGFTSGNNTYVDPITGRVHDPDSAKSKTAFKGPLAYDNHVDPRARAVGGGRSASIISMSQVSPPGVPLPEVNPPANRREFIYDF